MSATRRRGAGWPVAMILLGFTGVGAGFALRGKPDVDPKALTAATDRLSELSVVQVERLTKALELPAAEASRLPGLLAGLQNGVDAATFQDAFESEDWWAPYRTNGRVSALVVRGKVLASLFVEPPLPTADELIARAASDKVASGLIKGSGRIYAAAAARLEQSQDQSNNDKNNKDSAGFVILAEVVSQAVLDAAAVNSGAALGISDGQQMLLAGGPPLATQALAGLVGREAEPAGVTLEDLPHVAARLPGGLWLWTVSATPFVGGKDPVAVVYGLWAVSALLLLAGFVMLSRRSQAPVSAVAPALDQASSQTDPSAQAISIRRTRLLHGNEMPPQDGGRHSAGEISVSETVSSTVPAVDLAYQKPHVLGRYTLLDRIGEGGMAEVFRAVMHGAEGFERTLVVKRMHPHLLAMPEAVAQFVDEARLQSGLAHPNIVSVFDFGRAGNDYFLALEYVAGKDLEKVLQRHVAIHRQPLPIPIAMTFVRELLLALDFAHTRVDAKGKPLQIVHRDVSLSNVLISYAGEVKLSDFGIVKAESRVSKTQLGMVKGNAGYMSPEQARGEEVDGRADVFAAGVVAFCCLMGHALYNTRELTPINQILRAAIGPGQTEFSRLDSDIANLEKNLASVIKRAMAPSIENRFASAGEFARALRPFATASREDISNLMHTLFADEISNGV